MKKTMTGMLAYSKMMSTELPEKTGTYTPISHHEIISKVRSEIIGAGFIITREDYSCSSDGKVAVGSFGLIYKTDPHIELCANFMNSYNKRYAFRFSLGGIIKQNNAVFMVSDTTHGGFKRMHTGVADILSSHKIKELIDNAGEYWDALVNTKDLMISIPCHKNDLYMKTGELFFETKTINTFQMNQIREEYEKINNQALAEGRSINLWDLYTAITFGVREGNPSTWMNDLEAIYEVFDKMIKAVSSSSIARVKIPEKFEQNGDLLISDYEMRDYMVSSGLIDKPVLADTDKLIAEEDDPNVLRVNYIPSDEEIKALKKFGIRIIVDCQNFDEEEFDGDWDKKLEEELEEELEQELEEVESLPFDESEEFEENFEESFEIPATLFDEDDDDDDF
jgi:hypothetical protein